jgi:hypothetical protein
MWDWVRSLFALTLCSSLALPLAARSAPAASWFRGNTHTHTLWSDGDAAPEYAADWYKSHGYQFLVLSDHNIFAEGEKWKRIGPGRNDMRPETLKPLLDRFGKSVELRERGGVQEMRLKTLDQLRAAFEEKDRFLFIQGEEITDEHAKKPIHHGAMHLSNLIPPTGGASVREILERTVRAAQEEEKKSGRPLLLHLNHPNFGWAVEPDDIAHVAGEHFFEVYNGHRGAWNYGDRRHKSTEQIWDYVLAMRLGKLGGDPLYALATDDTHQYFRDQAVTNPGRGWVMVRAEELSAEAITRAMLAGDFYASSGVTLESVSSDREGMKVRVAAQPDVKTTIRFMGTRMQGDKLGEIGVVLQESTGPVGAYLFKSDELYVRATVVSSRKHPNGYSPEDFESAWTQPVVVHRLSR